MKVEVKMFNKIVYFLALLLFLSFLYFLSDESIVFGFNNSITTNDTSNIYIGNGTVSSNYPFTTYWEDGRTDILFCSDELISAGAHTGYIIRIGFNVISADTITLHGFKIKFIYLSPPGCPGVQGPFFTTCFDGNYKVPGPGWQFINLTSPYSWTSGQNLMVEVCYNNSAYSNYSPVYATSATSRMSGFYTDLPTGDGCTAAWTATVLSYRSNICFVMTTTTNIGNINEVPAEFNLSQNYPNPFNPNTKIDFAISKNGFVTLKIYDLLGRDVKNLVSENKTAGYYSIDFNGSEFPSEVYFYKLKSNGFSDVKRMILIK